MSKLHIFVLFNLANCDELSTYIEVICATSFFFVKGMLLEIWPNFVMILPCFFGSNPYFGKVFVMIY